MADERRWQNVWGVRRGVFGAALCVVLSGCGGGGGSGGGGGGGSDTATGEGEGASQYTAQCAGCHGAQGQGGAGPALDELDYTLEALIALIDSDMPPSTPSNCEDSCAEDVAAYITDAFMDSGDDDGDGGGGSDDGSGGSDDDEEPEESASEYYEDYVETDIVQSKCALCHTNGGLAQSTGLLFSQGNNRASRNEAVLTNFFYSQDDAYTYILSKVRGGSAHGGGVQLACEDEGFGALENFFQLLLGEDAPPDEACAAVFWDGIEMADAQQTLRRASLILAGRLPSAEEFAQANTGGDGLRQAIRGVMEGEHFHEFLLRGANDRLLSKALAGDGDLKFGDRHDVHYPELSNRSYLANIAMQEGDEEAGPEFIGLLNGFRFAGAMAPLKLIAHVVENDRPYTEILTADYTMVNPHTNIIFRSGVAFEDETDYLTFKPGKNNGQILEDSDADVIREDKTLGPWIASHGGFIDYPHAGLLNDVALLNRYPSTDTNRNRGRSRWTYYQFLNVDIEKSAARSTDPEDLADTDNPTLNNPACTACHSTLDPVAGAFQNYGDKGHYRGSNGGLHSLPSSYTSDRESSYEAGDLWYRDMLTPGFGSDIIETDNSLQVLAQRIVNDERFAQSVVSFWWQALMSAGIQDAPEQVSDKDYGAQFEAYEAQQETVQALAAGFASGFAGQSAFNLKDLLVEMAMSPWFRAATSRTELAEEQEVSLAGAGIGRLLTPEELALKTQAVTGILWGETTSKTGVDPRYDNLSHKYTTYYGGIDSFGITTRATELTPLMSNVAMRLGLAVSCPAVVMDFQREPQARLLFDTVELSMTPTTHADQIKAQLKSWHQVLLGETLSDTDEELGHSFTLFQEVWAQRWRDGGAFTLANGSGETCETPEGVTFSDEDLEDPEYMASTWTRMLLYFLTDYRYLHE